MAAAVASNASQLDNTEKKLERPEVTLEQKQASDAEGRRRQIAALRADIERQEKLVAEVDAKLNVLEVGRGNSVVDQLNDEILYQQNQISALEARLQDYKSGIANEDSNLKSLKYRGNARKYAVLLAYQDQIDRSQNLMKNLREKLRNRRNLLLSLDDTIATQNQFKAAQNQFSNLKQQYEAARRADYSDQSQQGQLSSDLAGARTDQHQLEQLLSVARKRLVDLQNEAKREEKTTTDKFKERDRLQNQLLNEKTKLAKMRDRLEVLERADAKAH